MNNPYRIAGNKDNTNVSIYKRNFFIKTIRFLFYSFMIFIHGKYKQRYPIKCPCGIRSWDPHEYRRAGGVIKHSFLLNSYRCGNMHDLRNVVYYG